MNPFSHPARQHRSAQLQFKAPRILPLGSYSRHTPASTPWFSRIRSLAVALAATLGAAAQAQSGNSMLEAHDLGVLNGPKVLNGSGNNIDAADYYRFEITESVGIVEGLIPGATLQGALTLQLIDDLNGNNIAEATEILDASQGRARVNASVYSWLSPGVYYARVTVAANNATSYQLTLSQTARPDSGGREDDSIGLALETEPIASTQVVQDFVGIADPVDFYRIDVTNQVHLVRAVIPKDSLSAYLLLSLYRDSNANGVPEDSEILASSTGQSNANAVNQLWLNPGTYFVRVDSYANQNTPYELTVSQSPRPLSAGPRDDTIALASARPLLPSAQPVQDFVGTSDPMDFYAFEVTSPVAEVQAIIPKSSLSGYLTLSIIRDDNENGVAEENEVMESATGQSNATATVLTWLDRGRYFIRVASYSEHSTEYSLTLSQDPKPSSLGLRDNRPTSPAYLGHITTPRQIDDYVGPSDGTDLYRFDIAGPSRKVTALIPKASLGGYVTLRLLADTDSNAILEEIKSDTGYSNGDALIDQILGPGTYYLQVTPYTSHATRYSMVLSRSFTGEVPPFILQPPLPQTIAAGKPATFSVQGDGSGTLQYQWYLDDQLLPGATAATLTLTDRIVDVRDYTVRVRITNALGGVNSESVRLQITPADVELGIARAVLLSWPVAGTDGYLVQGAPTANGPWTFLTNRLVTLQGNRREFTVENPAHFGAFRLAKP